MTDRKESLVDIVRDVNDNTSGRRRFLAGTGIAGAGLLLAACGSSSNNSTSNSAAATSSGTASGGGATSASPSAAAGASGDVAVAKLAASLEVLAVGTYKAALDAATAGKLGAVPPAVATFATTAMQQHQAALDKWNGVITGAGGSAVSTPPADLQQTVTTAFTAAKTIVDVANLALLLEQTASDTYFGAVSSALQGKDAIALAGSIQIIDQQHAAILHYVLGDYPVPDVFQKGDKAYKPPA